VTEKGLDNYNNLNNNKELRQRLRAGVIVLGQHHLLYSAISLIGSPITSALVHGSISLFISVLATPFPFP
jgi:hypothetical protein